MATEVVCGLIFRVLLPVCLAAGKSLHRHLFSVFAPVKGLGGFASVFNVEMRSFSVTRQVRMITQLLICQILFEFK